MNLKDPKIVIFGSGIIGSSIGAWLRPYSDNIYFLDRPPVTDNLRKNGVSTYLQNDEANIVTESVKVIEDLDEAKDADIIILGVKNYSLDAVAKLIKDKVGDHPYIIAIQNGVVNQTILPNYFSKVIYSIIGYNAWADDNGAIGYQSKGPLVFATEGNKYREEMDQIAEFFNQGVETIVVDNLGDISHTKLILNLTNSLTTLVGFKFKPISDPRLFQKVLSNLTYEGVKIAKSAGFNECSIGNMPSWTTMGMAAKLPTFITKSIFEKNIKKMVVSSMAQDVIQRGSKDTELETINGHFLSLAKKNNLKVPYNQAVYDMCQEAFAQDTFNTVDIKDVWEKIQSYN